MADDTTTDILMGVGVALAVALLLGKINDTTDAITAPIKAVGNAIGGVADAVSGVVSGAGNVAEAVGSGVLEAGNNSARVTKSGGAGIFEATQNVVNGATGQPTQRTKRIDPAVFLETVPKIILTPIERDNLTWESAGLNPGGYGPTGGSTARLLLSASNTYDYSTVPPVIERSLAQSFGKALYNAPLPGGGVSVNRLVTVGRKNVSEFRDLWGRIF